MPEITMTKEVADGKRVQIHYEISEDLLREDIGIPYAVETFKSQLTDWLDTHPKEA